MDNPCTVCAANGMCPYYGLADSYFADCDEVLMRYVDGKRNEYRKAWDSYMAEDENIDFSKVLSSLL